MTKRLLFLKFYLFSLSVFLLGSVDYDDPAYFKRGFFYTTEQPKILPPHYCQVSSNLWVDKIVDVGVSKDKEVYIWGLCVDIRDANTNLTKIANNLAQALNQSEESLHVEEEYLAGRYAILYESDGEKRIFSDALSVRDIYYSFDGKIIAGHAKLVADNLAEKVVKKQLMGMAQCIGRQTPYKNVFILTPNTSLKIETGEIRRFYPRDSLKKLTPDKAAQMIIPWLQNVLKGVASIKPLAIGLTGGKDSRTTMSICRSIGVPVLYFTYLYSQGSSVMDACRAQEIAKMLGLDYQVINVPNSPPLQETSDIITTNAYQISNPPKRYFKSLEIFNQYFGTDNYIVILPVFEEGCAQPVKTITSDEALHAWYYKRVLPKKTIPTNKQYSNWVKEAINDYLQTTQFKLDRIFNYHPLDLLYFEQKLLFLKTNIRADIAYESIIHASSRAIITTMLRSSRCELNSPKASNVEIVGGRNINVLRYIMNRFSPELAEFPFS